MPRKQKLIETQGQISQINYVPLHSNTTYFFVDSDGTEGCSNEKPYKHAMGFWMTDQPNNIVELPKGTIYRIYGVNLTYVDDPITEQITRE